MKDKIKQFKNWDYLLAVSVLVILIMGLVTIFSSTYQPGEALSYYARNQMIFALLGVPVFIGMSLLDYRVLRHFAIALYALSLVLLTSVLFIGKSAYGATSWINFGAFEFQPSELAKVATIIMLAHFFGRRSKDFRGRDIIYSLVILAPSLILLRLQPDVGTAIVFSFIWLAFFLTARPKWQHVAVVFGTLLIALPLAYTSLKGYQKSRFTVFAYNITGRELPEDQSQGIGYNVAQSQIAVGAGGLTGRGLGKGTQSALKFLPIQSQQTDFIFAVYAEQLGFVGSVILLGLYGTMIYRIYRIAEVTRDVFGSLVAIGAGTFFFFHVMVNIGFNIGVMPVTGIPLPLMSYGGSALMTSLILAGIAQSIYRHRRQVEYTK